LKAISISCESSDEDGAAILLPALVALGGFVLSRFFPTLPAPTIAQIVVMPAIVCFLAASATVVERAARD
jgi:hypothetical protein